MSLEDNEITLHEMPPGAFGLGLPRRTRLGFEHEFRGHFFRELGNGQELLGNSEFQTLVRYGFNLRGLECEQRKRKNESPTQCFFKKGKWRQVMVSSWFDSSSTQCCNRV